MSEKQDIVPKEPDVEVVSAMPMLARAEIETQIATAKQYPRDIAVFKSKLMAMANLDQETAEGCYYALPRGGKAIDGPSIRLAEIALACYQNCIAEADVVGEDAKFVYAMGQSRDLENNTAVRIKVRRRITDKDGRRYNDDMVAVTANAACAIALRNAIFKIVPAAYLKPVFEKVKETAVGKAESLASRRAEVMKRIVKFGVTKERVLRTLGRKSIEEVTFDDVAVLIGLGTAIKDGDTTVDEAFPESYDEASDKALKEKQAASGSQKVDAKGKAQAKKGKGKKQDTKKKTDAPPADAMTFKYNCTKCGAGFDSPKMSGPEKTVVMCPACGGMNCVVLTQTEEAPDFMKDD
jgi:DNA-directed RNA polymerase subunit RPC12/RpoP